MNNSEFIYFLKNTKAKAMIEKTTYDYLISIIDKVYEHPVYLYGISSNLQIPLKDTFKILTGEKKENIAFYDQALLWIYEQEKEENNNTISR